MTAAQRAAIALPAAGLIVYQTDGSRGFYYYTGSAWVLLLNGSDPLPAISGANLTNLNASNITSGSVPAAQLGSGTASSSTYLRGDGVWSTPSSGASGSVKALFRAYQTSSQTITNVNALPESYTKINFQTKDYDPDGTFNASTGAFTAPAAGTYLVNVCLSWAYSSTGGNKFIRFYSPSAGAALAYHYYSANTQVNFGSICTVVLKLSQGQTLEIDGMSFTTTTGTSSTTLTGSERTYFQVTRLE